ncbi:hypothetical protein FACS189461_5810 [Spirochaetia bacterium]|nr:hypothetical protein FACS189461_5810 [Spirochaetia bacterium]
MKRNDCFMPAGRAAGVLVMALTLGLALAGCASGPKELPAESGYSPVALGPHLEESLRKYTGPQMEKWWDDVEEVAVYYLDPRRFEAFKAELDALGDYQQNGSSHENRDWDQGKTLARLGKIPNDRVLLTLARADNSTFDYEYTKKPEASELKLDELLRKYTGPKPETWGDGADAEDVYVYFLDSSRFDTFKAEVSAGGEYFQGDSWITDNRDWDLGRTFARLVVKPNGKVDLEIGKEDNSFSTYHYKAYSGPLKTVKLTGYSSSQGITSVYQLALFLEAPTLDTDIPSTAKAGIDINGQTITCTLLNDEDWRDNPVPFTGTGKFYIQLHFPPARYSRYSPEPLQGSGKLRGLRCL